jgi:uncharacterized Zn-finger protein
LPPKTSFKKSNSLVLGDDKKLKRTKSQIRGNKKRSKSKIRRSASSIRGKKGGGGGS